MSVVVWAPRFNVRDFGALGDDISNDAASCQAAINACIATGGGTVYFPQGVYRIARTAADATGLKVAGHNVTLELDPFATIKLETTGSGTYLLFLGDVTNTVQYTNLRVIGGKLDGGASTDPKLIRVGWTKNVEVRAVEMFNTGGAGSSSAGGVSVAGKDTSNRSSEILVADCYIHDIPGSTVSDGIILNFVTGAIVRGNRIVSTGRGVFCSGPNSTVSILGNTLRSLADNGIRCSSVGGGTATSDNLYHTIIGNTLNTIAVDGIRIDGSQIVVNSNTVVSASGRGIKADIAQMCTITDNNVTACSNEGIYLAQAGLAENGGQHRWNVIGHNTVKNNNGAGIRIQGGGYSGSDLALGNLVQGNYCYGNAGGGLEMEACDNLQVLDNILEENTNGASSGDKQGIFIDMNLALSSTHGITVRGNRAWDLRGAGNRQIRGCRVLCTNAGGTLNGAIVEHNDFSYSITNGIQVPAPTGTLGPVRIDRNQVHNNSTPISCRSTDTGSGNIGTQGLADVSGDRGDTSPTVAATVDEETQIFATTLGGNRTITLTNTSNATVGARFRIVRTGLGAFTLTVQDSTPATIKVVPSATAAFVDAYWNGANWKLGAYGTL
jgi:hypothetical protein